MLQHHCYFGRLIVAFLFRKIAVAFSFTGRCTTAAVAKVATPACHAIATASHVLLALAACCSLFQAADCCFLKKNLLLLVCCCGCRYLLHAANCCQGITMLMRSNLHRFAAWCYCCRCRNSDAAAWYCHRLVLPSFSFAIA